MTLHQQREHLRLEIITATMRLDWAKREAAREPTTPALKRFIEDSQEERRVLRAKLAETNRGLRAMKEPPANH